MVITQPGASYNLKPGWYDGGNGKGSRSALQVRYRDGHQGDPRAKGGVAANYDGDTRGKAGSRAGGKLRFGHTWSGPELEWPAGES